MKELNTEVTVTMTSREIAELTGKQLAHVHRDIMVMLAQVYPSSDNYENVGVFVEHKEMNGRVVVHQILLDREHTECLITGYSAELRMKVIRRVRELEKALLTQAPQPQMPDIRAVPPAFLRQMADLIEENASLKTRTETPQPAADTKTCGTSLREYAHQRDAVYRFLGAYPEGGISLGFITDQLRHRAPFKKAGKPERAVNLRKAIQRMVDDGYLESCLGTEGCGIRVR